MESCVQLGLCEQKTKRENGKTAESGQRLEKEEHGYMCPARVIFSFSLFLSPVFLRVKYENKENHQASDSGSKRQSLYGEEAWVGSEKAEALSTQKPALSMRQHPQGQGEYLAGRMVDRQSEDPSVSAAQSRTCSELVPGAALDFPAHTTICIKGYKSKWEPFTA